MNIHPEGDKKKEIEKTMEIKMTTARNPMERYKLVTAQAEKMQKCLGNNVSVAAYAIYTEESRDGGEKEVVTILTDGGEVYGTISPTFLDSFKAGVEAFKPDNLTPSTISVRQGLSKSGREFIYCVVEDVRAI